MTEEEIREDERLQIAQRICGDCKKQGKPEPAQKGKDYPKRHGGTVSTNWIHKDGKFSKGCAANHVWPIEEEGE